VSQTTDANAVFAALAAAAQAAAHSPMRRGSTIHLPAQGDVLITGDLHADIASFERIVKIAELDRRPSRHLVLQELVHASDGARPGASCLLAERAAALIACFPDRVHLILGNHEAAEFTGRVIIKESVVLNHVFEQEAASRYGAMKGEALARMHALWRSLPLAVRTQHRMLVTHSTPSRQMLEKFDAGVLDRALEPADFERGGSAYAFLWGRDFTPATTDMLQGLLGADVFVVGHTPCPDGWRAPNGHHIILDSQGPSAACLVAPLDRPLTYDELRGRIRPIWA
jgi:hypothetical protein